MHGPGARAAPSTVLRRSEGRGCVAVALSLVLIGLLLLPGGLLGPTGGHAASSAPPRKASVAEVRPGPPSWVAGDGTPLTVARSGVVTVRDLPPYSEPTPFATHLPAHPPRPRVLDGPRLSSTPTASAPVVALSVAAPNVTDTIGIGSTGEGINANQCGCSPPDVQIGVGSGVELEMVNLYGAVVNGTAAFQTSFSLTTFFGTGPDYISDPRVVYDTLSSRWFASILDLNSTYGGLVRLAVSTSSSPTGTWDVYWVAAPSGEFADQPILGLSSNAIAISGDDFSSTNFYGSEYWVFNKTQAVDGAASLSAESFGPNAATYEIHPVQTITSSADLYMAMTNYGGSTSFLELFDLTGVPPAAIAVSVANLTVHPITSGPSAVQPGTSDLLDVGDSRVATSSWAAGVLWVGFDDQCRLTNDTAARSCVRLVSVNTATDTVLEDFDVSLLGSYLYYPGLAEAIDGHVTIVLGASSSTLDPSLLVTGRLPTDAANTVQPGEWLVQGSSNQACGGGVCRYGDYFGGGTVPGTTGAWVAGEYGGVSSIWQTYFGQTFWRGPLEFTIGATPTSVEAGQSVNVQLTLENSTCGGGTYCIVHVPLGPGAYDLACSAFFFTRGVNVTLPVAGNISLGSGGWAATYSSSTCASASLLENISTPTVVVHVDAPLVATVTADPPGAADVGQSVVFTSVLTGGRAPYTVAWLSVPFGCVAPSSPTLSCTPSRAGATTLHVVASDGYGIVANGSLDYLIDPALSATLSASRPSVEVGQVVSLTVTAAGGSGTYTVAWAGLPPGCVGTGPTIGCQPSLPGGYAVNATVTDSNGFSVTTTTFPITIVPAVGTTLNSSSSNPSVNDVVTFTVALTGGEGPFAFNWTGLPPGCSPASTGTLSCTPGASGTYRVTVTVTDALGGVSQSSVTLTVAGATSAAGTGVPTLLLLAIVALVAVGAVAGVVLVVRRRRRAAGETPSRPDEPDHP